MSDCFSVESTKTSSDAEVPSGSPAVYANLDSRLKGNCGQGKKGGRGGGEGMLCGIFSVIITLEDVQEDNHVRRLYVLLYVDGGSGCTCLNAVGRTSADLSPSKRIHPVKTAGPACR